MSSARNAICCLVNNEPVNAVSIFQVSEMQIDLPIVVDTTEAPSGYNIVQSPLVLMFGGKRMC
jgi:hypothetical protein